MTTSGQLIKRLDSLSEKTVCEMYGKLISRAMDTNPLKSWEWKMNPTREDLAEVIRVLPPSDCKQLEDEYF